MPLLNREPRLAFSRPAGAATGALGGAAGRRTKENPDGEDHTHESGSEGESPDQSSGHDGGATERENRLQSSTIIALLRRPGGASLDDMMSATGWQKHLVRGFMAGALKKQHGLTVTSEKTNEGRTYRVAPEVQQ